MQKAIHQTENWQSSALIPSSADFKAYELNYFVGNWKVGPTEHTGQDKEYGLGTDSQRYVRNSLRPNNHRVLLPLQENKFRSYLLGAGSLRGRWIDSESWPWLFLAELTREAGPPSQWLEHLRPTILTSAALGSSAGRRPLTAGHTCLQPSEKRGSWPETRSSPDFIYKNTQNISTTGSWPVREHRPGT